jgi:ABC-type transport system involved in cytochrome c biogenesis permease subunit
MRTVFLALILVNLAAFAINGVQGNTLHALGALVGFMFFTMLWARSMNKQVNRLLKLDESESEQS